MNYNDSIIHNDEKAVFTLRELYRSHGYRPFRMRRFEEYDLYVENKDFLPSDSVITFTDTDGRLLAMKPDVTLSIIKNTHDAPGVQKLYYDENVYRVSSRTHCFKEIMQAGVECIGEISLADQAEVLLLAAESLSGISGEAVLNVSHPGIISEVLAHCALSYETGKQITRCIYDRNLSGIDALCAAAGVAADAAEVLKGLARLHGRPAEVLPVLAELTTGFVSEETIRAFAAVMNAAAGCGIIRVDFSVAADMNYYSGIVFTGFIDGLPAKILSGGEYTNLMRRMGRSASAIGFAVYLDALDRMEGTPDRQPDRMLNVALPKGRLGEKVYEMFEKAGFPCPAIKENNRRLTFENPECGIRYFWVKPSDVPVYVERGAADIGVAGKDILLEYEPDVFELLDLDIGKCRMAVAAPDGFADDAEKTLRVATKFEHIARTYYAGIGRDIDIIHLNGSIEIAPLLGLSDVIVDIVETGTTLRENNLHVVNTVMPISARLIANRAGMNFLSPVIEEITEKLRKQTEAANG